MDLRPLSLNRSSMVSISMSITDVKILREEVIAFDLVEVAEARR